LFELPTYFSLTKTTSFPSGKASWEGKAVRSILVVNYLSNNLKVKDPHSKSVGSKALSEQGDKTYWQLYPSRGQCI